MVSKIVVDLILSHPQLFKNLPCSFPKMSNSKCEEVVLDNLFRLSWPRSNSRTRKMVVLKATKHVRIMYLLGSAYFEKNDSYFFSSLKLSEKALNQKQLFFLELPNMPNCLKIQPLKK